MNRRRYYGKPQRNRWWFVGILLFLIVSAHIQHSVVFVYRIIGSSMEPQFEHRDRLVGVPLLYGSGGWLLKRTVLQKQGLRYGDVVLIYPPQVEQPAIGIQIVDYLVRLISLQFVSIHDYKPIARRVVALEGDQLYMENYLFYIKQQGTSSFEPEVALATVPYSIETPPSPVGWDNNAPFGSSMATVTVPHRSVFVAADNRFTSLDSRHWKSVATNRVKSVILLHIGSLVDLNMLR